MQIAQFAKADFNLRKICNTKKFLFRSTRWKIVPLSICVICANCTICKSCFQFECNLQNEEMSFRFPLQRIVPLSICVICANCTICRSCFQFECNLQNEEIYFRFPLRRMHNLQKLLFSIWVQSAKWRNVFSDLLVGGSYPYQFV